MYGDVGNTEKLEKDRTLMLRPIMTDQTRPVTTGTLLEMTERWGPASGHFEQHVRSLLKCTDDR